jgi:predicted DNA-binding protein (MmcQ/YjbR family)
MSDVTDTAQHQNADVTGNQDNTDGQVPLISHKEVEAYVLSMSNARLEYPFGKDVAVYKTGAGDEAKMFALISENKKPVQVSLKCDPQLSVILREKYESVMPGYHLNKKHWNTIVLTGQLSWDEVKGLILHSYNLVTNSAADHS